ncbi:response regulator transcription factor [Arcticibacter sp.]|uniref:response regulator transcription factor n=1 Tax=Arcticibacter sp. TaxID=1872630 RepID=UPI0038909559
MNLIKQNQSISPALVSPAAEFFKTEDDVKCMVNGVVYAFNEIPKLFMNIVLRDMMANRMALSAMKTAGINDVEAQLKYYIGELYGAFDNKADISADGILQPHEFVYTRTRKLKRTIELKHGSLTAREIEVLTEIGLGKLDKEICEELCISNNTLRNHKDNISEKAGTERKGPLSTLAYKLNLVDLQ